MHAEGILEIDRAEARLRRMRRTVLTSARLLSQDGREGGFRGRWAMLTLTYAPEARYQRRDVTGLLKCIRGWLKRRGHVLRYVWVMELTTKGVPHYHMGVYLPRGLSLPKPDKQGWWPYGHTRIEWARHVIGYLAKYLSKAGVVDGHDYPKGARISGAGGMSQGSRREKRWWLAPSYVRELCGELANLFRAVGGGWLDRETGQWCPPRWRLVGVGRRFLRLIPVADGSRHLQGLSS